MLFVAIIIIPDVLSCGLIVHGYLRDDDSEYHEQTEQHQYQFNTKTICSNPKFYSYFFDPLYYTLIVC